MLCSFFLSLVVCFFYFHFVLRMLCVITIYAIYMLIRTFVGTNLNPLWEKFLVSSEGKDAWNYIQLHKGIFFFFFMKKKSKLFHLQRAAHRHPY